MHKFSLVLLTGIMTVDSFQPKRPRFLKFHGHQTFQSTHITDDQMKTAQTGMLKRNKQLMSLIANTKKGFTNELRPSNSGSQ